MNRAAMSAADVLDSEKSIAASTRVGSPTASRCDTVALGGHDHGFVERAIFGSVRAKLLRAASTTVLIAPHASH